MATKAAYGPEEWQVLQWAVTDTMTFVSLSDPGFWDSFKEASAAARFLADQRSTSTSLLVRDLAGDVRTSRDRETFADPSHAAGRVTARLTEAMSLVRTKDAADVEPFREFLLGLTEATAEAAGGIADGETSAMAKIRFALA